MRPERRALLLGLLLALLAARSLRALFSTAFYESLATLRLNQSAFWLVLLLLPALASRRALLPAVGALGLASAALPFARFTDAYLPLAAFASGAGLLAFASAARRPGAGGGFLAGIALDGGLLVVGRSHDPTLAAWSVVPALVATGAALALALRDGDAEQAPRRLDAGLALGALLAVELAFLASPYALARWLDVPVWMASLAALAGLAGGALLARGGLVLWGVGALALLDVAFLGTPLRALSALALQVALGAAGARLAPRASPLASTVAFAPLAFVLLYFREPLGLPEWGAIVPVLALATLAAVLRAPRGVPRGGAGVVVLVAALALVAALPTPVSDASGRELTVVTWNVHQAFGNRGALDPEVYADALRAIDPDVVFLQEADTARLSSGGIDVVLYLADALAMRAVFGDGGPAILTRVPLAPVDVHEEPWGISAAVDVDGTRVHLQSVHFARSRAERAIQAVALAAEEGSPRIVGGDFNFFNPADAAAYGTLTARYADAWIAAGGAPGDPAGNTHSARNTVRRIDLVLVDGLEVLESRPVRDAQTRLGSDHYPVMARVRVPAA